MKNFLVLFKCKHNQYKTTFLFKVAKQKKCKALSPTSQNKNFADKNKNITINF